MTTPRSAAALLLAALAAAARAETPAPPGAPPDPNRLVRDGVVIEFSLANAGDPGATLLEGDQAEARFRMTDAASGKPVSGLAPAAWLDLAGVVGGRAGEERECKDKIGLYLQGSVGIRPMVDLNSYYLLVMNADASISVIDPVVSMTGNTSLFASVLLKRPPADWAKTADEKRLFVSQPKAGEVAAVNAETFKLLESVPAGEAPTRVALQADGRYLWVGNDAAEEGMSGVTVIDAQTLRPVTFVATGKGHHEIAFSHGDRYAFVTNRADGTVSVIDVAKLAKVKDLATGPAPISVASSTLSRAVYVADGKAGTVAVVDPEKLEIRARIAAKPGLGPMRFTQDGRFGLVVNTAEHAVYVLDASEDRVAHRIDLPGKPYQVSFTRAFAYVRLLDSERVQMVSLGSLGKGGKPTVQSFAAGAAAPLAAGELPLADGIAQAATDAAVFVVNPAESTTFFYMEGMNAPMGSYGGYGHRTRAVTVVDRTLKEVEPGVYSAKLRVPAAGTYDVALLLDNPRVLHCFRATAEPNPKLAKDFGELAVEFPPMPRGIAAGTQRTYRVKLTHPLTRAPRTGLGDVFVVYHRQPGGPRQQAAAVEKGEGVYEATLDLAHPGTYYAFLAVPSLHLEPSALPYQGFVVEDPSPARAQSGGAREGDAP